MSFNSVEVSPMEVVAVIQDSKAPKFVKSSSLSSVKTATEGYLEQETLCRKISLAQKERFIQMIT